MFSGHTTNILWARARAGAEARAGAGAGRETE